MDDPHDTRVKANSHVCKISSEITMTTFSKTSDGQKPYIKVDSGHKLAQINPNIYSGFTEYEWPHPLTGRN